MQDHHCTHHRGTKGNPSLPDLPAVVVYFKNFSYGFTMNLDRAIVITVKAHAGQTDKVGEPYILHPLRVMMKMTGETERMAAILHDVIEDSPLTLAELAQEGFQPEVIEAVDSLTRRKNEDYEDYVERASKNPLARKVKLADLEDNMNFRRQHGLVEQDKERMARYQKAYQFLTGQ